MTEQTKRHVRAWWLPSAVAVLAVVIAVNYMLLIPSLKRQAAAARSGEDARVRQCETKPIARRVYSWLESEGVITENELRLFLSGAPSDAVCREITGS